MRRASPSSTKSWPRTATRRRTKWNSQGRGENLDSMEKRRVRKTRACEQKVQVEVEGGEIRHAEGLESVRNSERCGNRVNRDWTERNRGPHDNVQHGSAGEQRDRERPRGAGPALAFLPRLRHLTPGRAQRHRVPALSRGHRSQGIPAEP